MADLTFLSVVRHIFVGTAALALGVWIVLPDDVNRWTGRETAAKSSSSDKPAAESSVKSGETWNSIQLKPIPGLGLEPLNRPDVQNAAGPHPINRLQNTRQERMELGRRFFSRIRAINEELRLVSSDIAVLALRKRIDLNNPDALRVLRPADSDWRSLAEWWKRVGAQQRNRDTREFSTAADRFDRLAAQPSSPARDQELSVLIVTCGRDWLKIPFDERTQQFDLLSPLGEDSPEMALQNSKRLYKILSGEEWSGRAPADRARAQ